MVGAHLTAVRPSNPPSCAPIKRGADIVFALAALVVLLACLPVIFALNAAFNRGPLFYRQVRMGQGGRPFTMIKLRTMRPGPARAPGAGLEVCRVTSFGALLRASHLDELPQALNILLGDMSLIGPRPDIFGHAVTFSKTVPRYAERHRVRPGLTGLAQVREGYCEGFDGALRKTRADLDYIASRSVRLDLMILAQTAIIVWRAVIAERCRPARSLGLQSQS